MQFAAGQYAAPNLKTLLADPKVTKLFHFARFDVAMFRQYLGVDCKPIYCTKIASKLVRTYTDKHGLKDLVRELLNVDLSKEQQSSDWGAAELSEKQLAYAANDVAYLHQLKTALDADAGARRPHRVGPGLFRFPAQPAPRWIWRAGKKWIFSRIESEEDMALRSWLVSPVCAMTLPAAAAECPAAYRHALSANRQYCRLSHAAADAGRWW